MLRDVITSTNKTDIDVIFCLANTNSLAKEEFLCNQTLAKPNNVYGNLNIATIKANLSILEEIQQETERRICNWKEKTIADILIDGNIKKNTFVYYNYLYNTCPSSEKKSIKELHYKANCDLYGKLDEAVFWSLLKEKIDRISNKELDAEKEKRFEEALDYIGPIRMFGNKRFTPSRMVIKRFSEIIHCFYGGIINRIPLDKEEFDANEACEITNVLLEEIGADKWKAEVDAMAAAASVSHMHKRIYFPGRRSKGLYNRETLLLIIVHEFGVHFLRAFPYNNQPISMFATGTVSNPLFDEGLAKAVEHAITGEYNVAGVEHYINIGLATVLNKNFREVFEIQKRLDFLLNDTSPSITFDGVQRAFRGTSELVNNKDLVYYNGTNAVWKYIEENIDNPMLLDNLFLTGKLNILEEKEERLSYEIRMGLLNKIQY